jgi:hypothetical protein
MDSDTGLLQGRDKPPSIIAMPVLSYASLEDVRRCIKQRRRMRFIYRKVEVIAEPHLFGNFRKTRAFVLCAWKIQPEEGWDYFRLAEMRDVDILMECFGTARQGFNPYDPKIEIVDTLIRV